MTRATSRRQAGVVVVTGASAGVGRATAVAFAERGARVALIARGEAGLDGAVKEIDNLGGRGLAVPTDVADAGAVEAAATLIEEELGPIDVWVNNAMTTVFAPADRITADEYQRATAVTYLGQVHGTLAALRRMKPRDRGTIVNVGSALAYRPIPLQAPYCAAKFAVRGFTGSLRTELLHQGSKVRVAMVHLPAVNTPQFGWCRAKVSRHPQPVPPIYEPDVAAQAIVRVALDGRRHDIVGVWNWLIIQGNKLAPGVLDPSFLSSLPAALRSLGQAAADRGRDVLRHPPRSGPLERAGAPPAPRVRTRIPAADQG
jgi:NAD(P)-dependent dehydrogenase (short-subunit alcohol dehydrogenase family)